MDPENGRPVVYVPQQIHPSGLAILDERAEVHTGFGPNAVAVDEVIDRIDGLLVRHEGIAPNVIREAPQLRGIVRAGAGFENLDVDAARARNIPVFITPSGNSRTVAELVFALALAVAREIPRWDKIAREGAPDLKLVRESELGRDLSEKTLGLIGIGRIGSEVARIGQRGFDMRILGYHPTRSADEIRSRGAEPADSLDALLSESDVISIQVPLNDATRAMMGRDQFELMKPTAILVNVSRGGIVDEAALFEALSSGKIAGAGIDVWDGKVPKPDNPLLSLDRVVASPHRGGRTEEAQERMGVSAAHALLALLAGEPVEGAIDVTAGS